MLNMSQTEIAQSLGVTYQQLQKYERGANRISASRLQRLCVVLRVPISFFFDGAPRSDVAEVETEADSDAAALNGFLVTFDGVALMLAFGRIRSANVRRAIVALVEQIAAEPEQTVH
jgi:transcriptional regulator with XRE-family HTH domain